MSISRSGTKKCKIDQVFFGTGRRKFINVPSLDEKKCWITLDGKTRSQCPFDRPIDFSYFDGGIAGVKFDCYRFVSWSESLTMTLGRTVVAIIKNLKFFEL